MYKKLNLVQTKLLLKQLEKVHLELLLLETFFLVLMRSDTKIHGKNLFI